MTLQDPHAETSIQPLLGPDDPPPFEIINRDGAAQLLLACDHASRRVPKSLGNLGIAKSEFERHIAYDIGTEAITRILSETLDAPAVLAGYSRLVLDINRPPGHPESIPEVSDNTAIPANQNLSEAEKDQRVSELHDPYHEAVGHTMAHIWNRGPAPALFSVHSFTPNYGNDSRPWDVGILWKRDPRIAVPMMELFRARGMNVGDNVPYSALDMAYTIDAHAGAARLATCTIEIRQDQVADEEGIQRWAQILTEDLGEIMTHDGLYEPKEY
jgi:predicted N-formylglutamate amidohydrolase